MIRSLRENRGLRGARYRGSQSGFELSWIDQGPLTDVRKAANQSTVALGGETTLAN